MAELTNEQKLASLRFQEQAVLMLRIKELYAKNYKTHDNAGQELPEHYYDNFVRLNPDSISPSEAINGLYKKNNVFFLETIPPVIQSLLVPRISLYKTFYEQKKSVGFDWQIPFDDYLGASEISSNSIDFLRTTSEGRLNGVGIKSFKYDYLAVNFAEVDTNIKANLVLTANSIEDFVKVIDINTDHPNYVKYDGIKPSQRQVFSYKDMVVGSLRTSNLDPSNPYKWNPHYYRIKAICGYATGDKNELADKIARIGYLRNSTDGSIVPQDREEINRLVDGIAQSKVILNLTPVSFDLSINENGTAELNIEYRAAIDTVLREEDSDLFLIGDLGQEFLRLKTELETKTKEVKKTIKDAVDQSCSGQINSDKLKEIKDDQYEALEELKKQVITRKSELHGQFLSMLVSKLGIYKITVPKEELGNYLSEKNFNEAKVARNRLNSFQSGKQAVVQYISNPNGESKLQAIRKVIKSNETIEEITEQTLEQINKDAISQANGQSVSFYYFYLGDLLNYALECFKTSALPPEQKPKIVLGSMYMTSPSNLPASGVDPDETILNLSDIPISLNLFTEFYLENVVKVERDVYYIKNLLYDLFKDNGLITAALSPRAFGIEFAGFRERLTVLGVTSVNQPNDIDVLLEQPVVPYSIDKPFGYKTINIFKFDKDTSFDLEEKLNNKESNYVFLYVTSQFPKSLQKEFETETGRELQNTEKGIYNFRIGSEVGLLKSIKFQRMTQPFLREAKAFNEGEIAAGRLISKFNASIDLFGNNIFRPGEFVYINPAFIVTRNVLTNNFLSNPDLAAGFKGNNYQNKTSFLTSELGVGGYYLINKVSTSISEGSFVTNLDCIFQAYPNRTPSDTNSNLEPCREATEGELDAAEPEESTWDKVKSTVTGWFS
jgi:hypothetical protein